MNDILLIITSISSTLIALFLGIIVSGYIYSIWIRRHEFGMLKRIKKNNNDNSEQSDIEMLTKDHREWVFGHHTCTHKPSKTVMWTSHGYISFKIYGSESKYFPNLTFLERRRLWRFLKKAM